MTPLESPDDRDREALRLIEQDYQHTGEFVRSIVGTTAAIRGWAVTVWLALLGVSFQSDLVELAVLAGLVTLAFWAIDAYHAQLYVQALSHAGKLERLIGAYYTALTLGDDDPDAMADFRDDRDAFRPGLYSSFRRDLSGKAASGHLFVRGWAILRRTYNLLVNARPRVFFSILYPMLVGVACIAAIVVGVR